MRIRLHGMPQLDFEGLQYTVKPVWVEGPPSYGYIAAAYGEPLLHIRISECFASQEELSEALRNGFLAATSLESRTSGIVAALVEQGGAERLSCHPPPDLPPSGGFAGA
jgi:hypothetical protein